MKTIFSILFLCTAVVNAFAGPGPEDKMAWFREAKFGMFIHWGLYSVAAGEWKGETGHGEWIQYTANISCSEYDPLAKRFNPTGFNADEWARLAKQAGMNYMVITAKHHDGFCMYDSQWTDFDIVDATPYKKDPMKDLAESCRKEGLKFCFYYSVKDWHHPEYHRRFTRYKAQHPEGFHGNPNPDADAKKYIAYMGNQLEELLTNYGEIGVIWFDYGGRLYNRDSSNIPHGQRVVDRMREIQPNLLINGRMGGGIQGDYGTPEQTIPGSKSTSPLRGLYDF
ncbi:MAG: alpha-L-fucosidase [Bdellovibrionaceae bacterium]|nr:alpha-L-fucosidase [Pseudobdellovibrionaceae bacterium]